mgnify:CR=1 FL=1
MATAKPPKKVKKEEKKMKVIIDSGNKFRDSWVDLIQVEKDSPNKFKFTDGRCSWYEKVKPGTYLVRTQSNRSGAPVFFHRIGESLAEKLQLLSVDLAVEIMDNIIHDGENSALDMVLSLQEAAGVWGLDDSTLRRAISSGRFRPDEYRKTGRNYIILKSAMERVYGKPE